VARRLAATLVGLASTVGVAACVDDGPPTSRPTATLAAGTTSATTTSEPKVTIPDGVLVAVPIQNRPDPAKDQFQIKIVNGTSERFTVAAVQMVWAGLTTEVVERANPAIVVGGQRIDLPVPLAPATCTGDGTRATMPSLDTARVVVTEPSGATRDIPVVDPDHVARRLYEEDCRRQFVESHVAIEWVDLHEGEFEGRPVTVGELRLMRREAIGEVAVTAISDTIPFLVDPLGTEPGEVVATLPDGAATVSVPVRFLESRCDPHALAEITQPTKFVAQVMLGGADPVAYVVYPDRDLWTPMRLTADRACVQLGKVVFVGDD